MNVIEQIHERIAKHDCSPIRFTKPGLRAN